MSSAANVNHVEVALPADVVSVGLARDAVSDALHRWAADEYHWCAVQVISELATNALLHARTAFTVLIRHGADGVWVGVADGSSLLPRPRHAEYADTTGRGLALVARCSHRWYVEALPSPTPKRAKIVWAQCLTDEEALIRSLDSESWTALLPGQTRDGEGTGMAVAGDLDERRNDQRPEPVN